MYADLSRDINPPPVDPTPSGFAQRPIHDRAGSVRIMLFVLWASLPLLSIVADVLGLVSERTSAFVVVPLTLALGVLMLVRPHSSDAIVGYGFVAGMIACVPYDVFRLSAVYVGHLMGDFIPSLGTWIIGMRGVDAEVVGYTWRYLGDAAGAGVGFYVVACALGLHRWQQRSRIVVAAVAYAVFPVWSGLIALVALAPRGQELMFHLTPATVLITLIGHLIFGAVLGLALVHTRRVGEMLPWPPISIAALRDQLFARFTRNSMVPVFSTVTNPPIEGASTP